MTMKAPIPSGIELHQRTKTLELIYQDNGHQQRSEHQYSEHQNGEPPTADQQGNTHYQLSCEYLRVYSPSAEVKGHGPGQEVLQAGKKNVTINAIKPVGNYALQFYFSDGHDTGIYSWDYLYELCVEQQQRWQHYIERLHEAGATRDPDIQVVRIGN